MEIEVSPDTVSQEVQVQGNVTVTDTHIEEKGWFEDQLAVLKWILLAIGLGGIVLLVNKLRK